VHAVHMPHEGRVDLIAQQVTAGAHPASGRRQAARPGSYSPAVRSQGAQYCAVSARPSVTGGCSRRPHARARHERPARRPAPSRAGVQGSSVSPGSAVRSPADGLPGQIRGSRRSLSVNGIKRPDRGQAMARVRPHVRDRSRHRRARSEAFQPGPILIARQADSIAVRRAAAPSASPGFADGRSAGSRARVLASTAYARWVLKPSKSFRPVGPSRSRKARFSGLAHRISSASPFRIT
jgi:hypothetical protein